MRKECRRPGGVGFGCCRVVLSACSALSSSTLASYASVRVIWALFERNGSISDVASRCLFADCIGVVSRVRSSLAGDGFLQLGGSPAPVSATASSSFSCEALDTLERRALGLQTLPFIVGTCGCVKEVLPAHKPAEKMAVRFVESSCKGWP